MYSIINLAGLAISLTCVIIIARYVYGELTVDGFNGKLDRIYLTTYEQSDNPGEVMISGVSNSSGGEKNFVDISKNIGVEKHSSFIDYATQNIVVENRTYSMKSLVIDSVFLQILDYRIIAGVNNIRRPEDVLITEAFAAKVFGNEDPLGKTFSYPSIQKTLTVAGIVGMPTRKSVLSFDVLISSQLSKMWLNGSQQSLILLYPEVDYRNINRQYSEFMEMVSWGGISIRYQLFPFGDIYFGKHINNITKAFAHGNLTYFFILLSIGVLLLIIGLTNYINIHSVVMTRRNRELGMKKIFGAEGFKIFAQLLLENLILIIFSLIIAFGVAGELVPFMENSLGVLQLPSLKFDLLLGLSLASALPIAVSIAPYLRYRYFSPIRSLQSVNAGNKSLFSRKFFLCFQYFMTTGLIAVSLFFVKQLNFMLDKDLGFRTNDIIKVAFLKNTVITFESLKSQNIPFDELAAISDVLKQKLNESTLLEYWSYGIFPTEKNGKHPFKVAGGEFRETAFMGGVGETWFKVFDIKLLDGRSWNRETDDLSYNLIVGESTLKQFGITDSREGELISESRLWLASGMADEMKKNPPYRIVGVVNDIYTEHLSKQTSPTVFSYSKGHFNEPIVASFAPGRKQEVIEFMKNLHDELIGGEFEYTLIEDEIAKLYGEDKKVSVICTVFTGMAILISMLGLLGISLFDIRQRRKEIAIRKIHGAMMKDVLSLLLKKYFVLLGLAFVVSIPTALFVIMKYLENFAYKAPVSWWLFAVALVVTVIVSLLTLIWQAYKAGSEPPAEVVKS
jgi:ABC-type antimicrobial peptide transport system permease subunit